MDWVKPFYTKQHEWMARSSLGDVREEHRAQASRIERLVGPPPLRVLELGAGGGQGVAAAADLGFDVTAVELIPSAAERAGALARQHRRGRLTVVEGDFYDVLLDGQFDVVCYWDGFGIGTDTNQRSLLDRIDGWLRPSGRALVEVYSPWYWARMAGEEIAMDGIVRRYGFDAVGSRMLDTLWLPGDESSIIEQSLRCYSPADLALLLEGTGLELIGVEPGGRAVGEPPDSPFGEALYRSWTFVATLGPGLSTHLGDVSAR